MIRNLSYGEFFENLKWKDHSNTGDFFRVAILKMLIIMRSTALQKYFLIFLSLKTFSYNNIMFVMV